jgi:hypothetical protein
MKRGEATSGPTRGSPSGATELLSVRLRLGSFHYQSRETRATSARGRPVTAGVLGAVVASAVTIVVSEIPRLVGKDQAASASTDHAS